MQIGEALSTLGKALGPGLIEHAKQSGIPMPAGDRRRQGAPTDEQLVEVIFALAAHYFPLLAGDSESSQPQG